MDWVQGVVLALIQGLTEFLPVSSSAHLILPSALLGWQDQGLAFDVAVHLGTLGAVVLYFRHTLQAMLVAMLQSCGARKITTPDARLAWQVILATCPAVFFGLVMSGWIDILRNVEVIATTTIVFGLLLWWADRQPKQALNEHQLSWKQAFLVGCAQALAVVPGTSRSGITMTAGLMLGMTRSGAARFSFLLSVPIILAASLFMGLKWFTHEVAVDSASLALGMGVSFVSAYLCIHGFLRLIDQVGMLPFVIYRLLLGGALLYLFVL
jgi:undecaprenyl-diphosphatase